MYHFTMFDFASVLIHLFIDCEEPQEEGRIIVKIQGVTVDQDQTIFYVNYQGLKQKREMMAAALQYASEAVSNQ